MVVRNLSSIFSVNVDFSDPFLFPWDLQGFETCKFSKAVKFSQLVWGWEITTLDPVATVAPVVPSSMPWFVADQA